MTTTPRKRPAGRRPAADDYRALAVRVVEAAVRGDRQGVGLLLAAAPPDKRSAAALLAVLALAEPLRAAGAEACVEFLEGLRTSVGGRL